VPGTLSHRARTNVRNPRRNAKIAHKSVAWLPGFGIQPQESVARRLLSSRLSICGCLALLLFASTLQAVHTCGSKASDVQVRVETQGASASVSPCLACILQAAAAILVITISLCGFAVQSRSVLVQLRPRVLLSSFQLDVRPPPVA
jgi:hypothetical protein